MMPRNLTLAQLLGYERFSSEGKLTYIQQQATNSDFWPAFFLWFSAATAHNISPCS
jgi:hypothetical protein